MKKFMAALLAAVMTMSLLTACGGSEEAAKTETAATEDGKSAALADGVLTVGTNAEFPPFEYVNDAGEPDGFDIALIKAIGEKLGVEVVVENMEFASLVSSIGSKIDVSIAGMTVTEDRLKNVNFTDTYTTASQVVIVKEGSPITSVADLEGKILGVQLGTTGDIYASDVEGAGIERYSKGFEAIQSLTTDKIDAVIIDQEPAKVFVSENEGLIILEEHFTDEEYAIAIAKDNEELVEAMNGALAALKESGKLDEIIGKYIQAE